MMVDALQQRPGDTGDVEGCPAICYHDNGNRTLSTKPSDFSDPFPLLYEVHMMDAFLPGVCRFFWCSLLIFVDIALVRKARVQTAWGNTACVSAEDFDSLTQKVFILQRSRRCGAGVHFASGLLWELTLVSFDIRQMFRVKLVKRQFRFTRGTLCMYAWQGSGRIDTHRT